MPPTHSAEPKGIPLPITANPPALGSGLMEHGIDPCGGASWERMRDCVHAMQGIPSPAEFMSSHRRLVKAASAMRERVTALLLHQANAGPVGLLGSAAQQSVLDYDTALSTLTKEPHP